MNKTFLQWFFWIAIKFLLTAHVKASRLISHWMIQTKTFPVSHITSYPPGSCHAAVMRGCDVVMWSWHGGAGNMKCCCAENENVHIVEIVCTLQHGLGGGELQMYYWQQLFVLHDNFLYLSIIKSLIGPRFVVTIIWAIGKKSSESDYGDNEADALVIVPPDPWLGAATPGSLQLSQHWALSRAVTGPSLGSEIQTTDK